jgi:hypothetical protein
MSSEQFSSLPPSAWDLAWSFVASMGLLVLLSPLYRSGQSFFDVVAARRVLLVLRCCALLELALNALLLYMCLYIGEPLGFPHAVTLFSNGSSWVYGAARPVTGLVLISFGLVGNMHIGARLICILGAILEAACYVSSYERSALFVRRLCEWIAFRCRA